MAQEFGGGRRRLRIVKLRARSYLGGFHDFRIETGGLRVYPRLISHDHAQLTLAGPLTSGIDKLDTLMGGGIDRGTATMLMGPAGTGKSTVAMQYACATAERGERVALFMFDEPPQTLVTRLDALGIHLRSHIESGLVTIRQIDRC